MCAKACLRRDNTFMCREHTLMYFWEKRNLTIKNVRVLHVTIEISPKRGNQEKNKNKDPKEDFLEWKLL